jgi:predicted transcriptional regulator
VLGYIARHPDDTMAAVADSLGLTERGVAAIIRNLKDEGYLTIEHRGRRNHYSVNYGVSLRRPGHRQLLVEDVLEAVSKLT